VKDCSGGGTLAVRSRGYPPQARSLPGPGSITSETAGEPYAACEAARQWSSYSIASNGPGRRRPTIRPAAPAEKQIAAPGRR
jgi:hypothetical protein